MLAAHEFLLGEFGDRHKLEFDSENVLKRASLEGSEFVIDGETELALPAGTEQVAQFMRYFELQGTGLRLAASATSSRSRGSSST